MVGGRSGDQGRTLYSLGVFAEEASVHPVWNEFYWDEIYSKFFNEKGCKKYLKAPDQFKRQVVVADITKFLGLPYVDFAKICERIRDEEDGTLCIIKGAPRVEPWKLDMWLHDGLIEWKVMNRAKKLYQELFFYEIPVEEKEEIIIHVRRGDLTDTYIKEGYDFNYYRNLINSIQTKIGKEITIFTLAVGAEDIFPLNDINGVTIEVGDYSEFNSQVSRMLGCSHLFMSHSGFTKAIYYAKKFGHTYIDESIFGGQYDKMRYYNKPENLIYFK